MAACTFDMQFTYVLVGWEGSTADSHVLKDALTRRDRIFVPEGKYYLVHASYANMPGFLAPYRETRYHQQEFGDNLPRNDKELFNRRHSSLRNNIEQTFSALKVRFQMVKGPPPFSYKIHMKIVIACCILHNYIRKEDYNDMFELEDDDPDDEFGGGGDEVRLAGINEDEVSNGSDDLGDEDNLSTTMWRWRA
ncbi:protein ALP1-like [Aristolochia californica]|uniref:protein ALP1-like n=1 Tax=Aristolochia californica TaxID=171875 RepID=UPI0035DA04C8